MLVEEGLPLSQSALWSYQRRYYEAEGAAAWRHDTVPHYITCNPYIADSYARLASSYIRDWLPHLDARQPLYIVELGAGSGRFAYLFLRAWRTRVAAAGLQGVPVTYVMTDLAARNVDFWQAHPGLAPFFHSDLLDAATFDLVHDETITLLGCGRTLKLGQVANPMIVIANYVFDSIPQDLFFVREGKVYAGLTTLSMPAQTNGATDERADSLLPTSMHWHDQLAIRFIPAKQPVDPHPYGDPVLDRVLSSYVDFFAGHDKPCAFTFPVGGYQIWRRFAQMAQGRLLLLSADKGYVEETDLGQQAGAGLAFHGGGFSLDVNYHALDRIVAAQGGHVVHGGPAAGRIVAAAYWGQEPAGGAVATRLACAETLGAVGPDDFYALVKSIEPRYEELTIPQVLALLRFSRHDPRILYGCLPALQAASNQITPAQRTEILARIAQVWDNYYHIEEEGDLAYGVGKLCLALGAETEAVFYLEQSNRLYGDNAHVCYELAECLLDLGRVEEASSYLDRVLAKMPTHGQALALRKEVGA